MDKELIKNILKIEFAYDLSKHEDEGEARVEDVATKIVKASDCIPVVSGTCKGDYLHKDNSCKKWGGECSKKHCDYYR